MLASCTILFPVYGSPLTVSSSNIMWSVASMPVVFASGAIPPFTTEIFALALPELKLTTSPIA